MTNDAKKRFPRLHTIMKCGTKKNILRVAVMLVRVSVESFFVKSAVTPLTVANADDM